MKSNSSMSSNNRMMPPLPNQPRVQQKSFNSAVNQNTHNNYYLNSGDKQLNEEPSMVSFSNNPQQFLSQGLVHPSNNLNHSNIVVPSDYEDQTSPSKMNQDQLFQSLEMNGGGPQTQYNQLINNSQRSKGQMLYSEQKDDLNSQDFLSCNNYPMSQQMSRQHNAGQSQYNQRQSNGNMSQQQQMMNQQMLSSGQTSFRTAMGGPQSFINNMPNERLSQFSNPNQLTHNQQTSNHQQRPSMYMDIQREIEDLKNFDDIFQDSQRKISAPTPYRGFNSNQFVPMSQQKQSQNYAQDIATHPYEQTLSQQNNTEQLNNSNSQGFNATTGQQTIQNPFENTNQLNNNRELLTITVDIAEGRQENILIRENDDPYQLATEFALMHNLNDQMRDLLAEQISMNIEQVLEEELQLNQNKNLSAGTQQFNQYLSDTQNMNEDQQLQNQYQPEYIQNTLQNNGFQQNNQQNNQNYYSSDIAEYAANHDSFQREQQQPFMQQDQSQNFGQNQYPQQIISPGGYEMNSQSMVHKNQSFINDEQNNRSGLFANGTGISGIINQSYLTDRSGQSNRMFQQPGSFGYQQWKQNVEHKMQLKDDRLNYPTINENSKRMIESKRQNNSSGSKSGTVHSRLHQQAVSKQRSQHRQQQLIFDQNQQALTKNKSFVNNSGQKLVPQSTKNNRNTVQFAGGRNQNMNGNRSFTHSNKSSPAKANYQDPLGQLQMMKIKNQQAFNNQNNGVRASSQQNARGSGVSTIQSSDRNYQAPLPKPIINYGERLYQKGIKRKEELDRHIREAKNYQEQNEQEQYTYQPQINAVSRSIPRSEDNLIKYGQQVREKIEQKRTEILLQEQAECKFRPMITKKSAQLLSDRYHPNGEVDRSSDKFSNLYEDAKRRKERQDKIYSACVESECTFQPDTQATKFYYNKVENRDPNRTALSGYSRGVSRDRSNKKQENKDSDLFDQDSGQPFFKPKVGRGPRNQLRPNARDQPEAIGLHLYDQSKVQRDKIEEKKKQAEDKKQQQAKTVFTKDHTNRLVEKKKIQQFSELFRQLDSDGDGQISANRIDISKLSPDLLEILTPLFCEMEEMGQTLDEDEFIDAAGRLYDSLPLPQKNIIIQNKQKWSEKSKMQEELHFKPMLNPNSLRIAAKKRPQEDVADILHRKQFEYNQKVHERMQEKENMELVGCTFHPQILQSPQSDGNNSSRVYNRSNSKGNYNKNPLSMNLSQQNLNLSNLNNSNNYGYQGQLMNQANNNQFDINNLAQNIANELYSKPQSTTNNQFMNNMLRGSNTSNNLNQDIDLRDGYQKQTAGYASSGNIGQYQQQNNQMMQARRSVNDNINNQNSYLNPSQNNGFNTIDPSSVNYGSIGQDIMMINQNNNRGNNNYGSSQNNRISSGYSNGNSRLQMMH
eukprot:403376977